jgi:hypothetical protein
MSTSAASRFLVGCCAFVFLAASAWAETTPATAEALMRKSGLWEQLADVAPQVRAGVLADVARTGRKPSETEIQRLSRAVASAYSVHRFRSACLAAISRDLAMIHVAALRRWYDGPSGRTIAKLELAQSKQDPRTTIEQGATLLKTMPTSRRRILDEIVLVTRSAELMTELNIGAALAAHLVAASVSSSSARRPSISELKAAFDAQRQQLIRTFSSLSLASYAAAYASVPTAELEAYVDFLKSEAGRQFVAIGTRALSAVMFDAAAELARTVPGSKDKAHT